MPGARSPMPNATIADAFDEMADLLAIEGSNPFRVRAYRRAATVVRGLSDRPGHPQDRRDLEELPGIGADLAGKILTLRGSGRLPALEALRRRVPTGLRELLGLPGLGPIRVRRLHRDAGVRTVADLERALAGDALAGLPGWGTGLVRRLRNALRDRAARTATRRAWPQAAPPAIALRHYLEGVPGVTDVEIAGSFRRGRDTVGDLDLVVGSRRSLETMAALRRYPGLRELDAAGPTKAAGVLREGLAIDVRVVPPESFGAALQYFTGSREFTLRLRRLAQQRGCKLNEYGLYRGTRRIAGAEERAIFAALGLPWIPPELRENRGEIEAARGGTLPVLIERKDLRGDLQVRTAASDGRDSLAALVAAARARGLSYLAVADLAGESAAAHALDASGLARQIDAIDALNATLRSFGVLKGVEVEILEDGRLALPDSMLRRLDIVVVALHRHFDLAPAKQTTRVLRALERPNVTILGDPSGRILGERAGCAYDFERVAGAMRARGCALAVDGQPLRLDPADEVIRTARDAGLRLSVTSVARSAQELDFLDHGVRQARRGWVRREDALNTRDLDAVRRMLRAGSP